MRSIAALLVASLVLVGAASAWTTTEQLLYQYTKEVDMQAGQDLSWLNDAFSSAQFSSNTGYGEAYGSVSNTVGGICADLVPVDGLDPDTHNSVTQWGSAVLLTRAPDLENPSGIQFAGVAKANQEVALSGNFNDIYACLFQTADISVGDWWTGDFTEARAEAFMIGGVSALDDLMIEANIGQSTGVGLEQINAIGALPTMYGEQTAWAGFDGAYDANGDGLVSIETGIWCTDANFDMFNI